MTKLMRVAFGLVCLLASVAVHAQATDEPLRLGSDCAHAELPDWTYDRAHNRLRLGEIAKLQARAMTRSPPVTKSN